MKVRNSIMILAVLVFSFLAPPSETPAGVVETPTEESVISNNATQLVIVTAPGAFYFYEGDELNRVVSEGSSEPTDIYQSLDQIDADEILTVIFISSDDALDSLSQDTIGVLSQLSASGAIIGIPGSGEHLREKLGIFDSADYAEVADSYNYLYFTYGVQDGAREDLHLSIQMDVTTGELLNEVVDWAREVTAGNKVLTDAGAWNATYSHDWRGTLTGGGYHFLVNVFKLNTDSQTNDWYLVQISYQSSINDYTKNSSKCGWFTDAMNLEAQVATSSGGTLYDYMPTGTVADTTTTFTIGGMLTSTQEGVTGSYSKGYSAPDVTITDKSSYVNNTADWHVSFTGPDFSDYPFYSQPCSAARNSYQVEPAFIAQTVKNITMEVILSPFIQHQLDKLTFELVGTKVSAIGTFWTNSPLVITVGP